MASTLTNQPLIQKSMNGIITVSDGVALLENGSLTNVNNINTNTINTQSFSSNDFEVSTNIDLLSSSSRVYFTIPSSNSINTVISKDGLTCDTVRAKYLELSGNMISNLNLNNKNITNVNNIDISGSLIYDVNTANEYKMMLSNGQDLIKFRYGARGILTMGYNTPTFNNLSFYHTIIGCGSLTNMTHDAIGNSTLGTFALGFINGVSSYNTAVGFNTACSTAVGLAPNILTSNYSTFLGAFSTIGTSGLQYCTSIGYGAIAQTNNEICLGRATETTRIPGNFHVEGKIVGNLDRLTNDGFIAGFNNISNPEYSIVLDSPHSVWIQSPTLVLKNNEITEVYSITLNDGEVGGIYNVNEISSPNDFKIYCGGQVLVNDLPLGTSNLNAVLTAGNNAGNLDITNIKDVYANQFIYSNFVKLNDIQTVSTAVGNITLTFPIPQFLNVIQGGTLHVYLPDLTVLPQGGSGSTIYILRGNNISNVYLHAYTGQEIKLMDNSLVTSFLFNSSVSNMLQLIFTRVGASYRWVQVNALVSNATTTGVIDTPSVYTLNSFSQINKFEVGLESYGSTYVENFTFSNLSSDLAIVNWDADIPHYGNQSYNLQYTGSSMYTGTLGVITSGISYSFYIVSGLYNGLFYTTYYPVASNQCFGLSIAGGGTINFKTMNYDLEPGEYLFGYYLQSQATALTIDAYIKDTLGVVLASEPNQYVGANYPNWVFKSMVFTLLEATSIYFECQNQPNGNATYILLTGMELTMHNAMIIKDTTTNKTVSIAGGQTTLNNVFIKDGLSVESGGLTVLGGINGLTEYGKNNTAFNTPFGSTSNYTITEENIAIGVASLQNLTGTSSKNLAIGNGTNKGATSVSNTISLGYNAGAIGNGSIAIGNNLYIRSSESVVVGTNNLPANQSVIGQYNCCLGVDTLGANVYNGYGLYTANQNVAIGRKALFNCSDHYNTACGFATLYTLNGRGGVNSGAITQYNAALGHSAGFSRALYFSCTFLGAKSDASVSGLSNSTAIGYLTQVDISNCIQLGSHGERVQISGDLSGVTTINGVSYPPTSGTNSLSDVLSVGNSAGIYDINLNTHDLLNVNNINLTTINGTAYPPPGSTSALSDVLAIGNSTGIYDINLNTHDLLNVNNINLTTINGSSYPPAYTTPSLSDVLVAGNNATTNNINMNSNNIINVANIATGASNLLSFNTYTTANQPIFMNTTGFKAGYQPVTLNVNDNFVATWMHYLGCHLLINNTSGSLKTLTIGLGSDYTGAIVNIENISSVLVNISMGSGTFHGPYGNATPVYSIYPGQTVEILGTALGYRVLQVKGVPMTYRMINTATQALATSATTLLYNSTDINGIQVANGIRTWSASDLTYSAGTFTNNSGLPMTLSIQATCTTTSGTTVRALGVNHTNNTRHPYTRPNWTMIPSSAGTTMFIYQNVYLGINDGFQIQGQSLTTATTISANSVLIITRLN